MILTAVELIDVRNYASLEFRPAPGLNLLTGDNAQGKSNLLEAIAMLGTGKSFRTAHEAEVVRNGQTRAVIAGEARVAAGTVRLACAIDRTARGARKTYNVNGRGVRYAAFLGRARVFAFEPGDLRLADGPPAARRALLNAALAQESPAYYGALVEYARVLAQKNALLRGAATVDEDLLDTYDERSIVLGTELMLERHRYVEEIATVAREAARRWGEEAENGSLEVRYAANVPFEIPTREAVRAAFAERLRSRRQPERLRGQALVGPHRDDLSLVLGGRALASFGSQGQRRTAVLALKVAEYTVMRARTGEAPLLLLDDVLSELDPGRQERFLESLGEVEQAFVTSAGLLPAVPVSATYRVRAAALTEMNGTLASC